MKNVSVEVIVFRVAAEVLHRLGTLSGEKLHYDVAQGRVENGSLVILRARLVLFRNSNSIFVRRLLVEHVSVPGAGGVTAGVSKTESFHLKCKKGVYKLGKLQCWPHRKI